MDQQPPILPAHDGDRGMSVEQKIDQLALVVKKGFDSVDDRFTQIDEQLTSIRATMVTKDYLDDKLADLVRP